MKHQYLSKHDSKDVGCMIKRDGLKDGRNEGWASRYQYATFSKMGI